MIIQQTRQEIFSIDKTSSNLFCPTFDSDLYDTDNVISKGLFDLDCGDDSPLMNDTKDDQLKEELLLEKHDLALCTISDIASDFRIVNYAYSAVLHH